MENKRKIPQIFRTIFSWVQERDRSQVYERDCILKFVLWLNTNL